MKELKIIFTLAFAMFSFQTFLYANNCNDLEMARMIKRGLSDKVIDQVCKEERNNSKNEIKQEKVVPIKPKINSTKEKPILPKEAISEKKEERLKRGTPAYWRNKESHGLGFGLVGRGYGVYYDYSLHHNSQINIFASAQSQTQSSLFGTNSVTTNSNLSGAKYRYFF